MSVDSLQEKIRKLKNPSLVELGMSMADLPPFLPEEAGSTAAAYGRFCRELLAGLKGLVPGVRVSFAAFALLGPEGLNQLEQCLASAREQGMYVLLDAPAMLTPEMAENTAQTLFEWEDSRWPCDGVVITPYLGSDVIKPFLPYCRERNVELFVLVRSSNRSAPDFQDLLTGSRVAHMAVADQVRRFGENCVGKCGYSRVAAVAAAGAPSSLKSLRTKYPGMFLLLDGYDYSTGNAKNCSLAFDRLGHGAAVCVGATIHDAWEDPGITASDYLEAAAQAAERVKKNFARYLTIL